MKLSYKPEIDGLRSLAILPVVLFHAGVPGFSGGYVGVDVFFVISGYLITSIILRELSEKRFSIVDFYERRIRRIFPALFAMILFVIFVSPLALLPSELRVLPREIGATVLFVANILFFGSADYFAASAEEKPLLHMWSLGVEEQFYIFAPLLLWLIIRYCPKALKATLLAVFAASLLLSVWLTPAYPGAAFYLLPARAWELLAGSILAAGVPRLKSRAVSELLAWAGIVLLLGAVFTFDAETSFPGYAALAPVTGAALLIFCAAGTSVGTILSSRPLVVTGLISYSLYLWHWPLIVFFRDRHILESAFGIAGVLVASFVASWISWRFIETPFRNRAVWPPARLWRVAGATAAVICALTFGIFATNGWPSRLSAEAQAYDNARKDISPKRKECHINSGLIPYASLCHLGENPKTAVFSDSHGAEISVALAEAGLPVVQITYSGCPPVLGYNPPHRPNCAAHNSRMLEALSADDSITNIIMTANYRGYKHETWDGFTETVNRLRAAGKTVKVLEQWPTPGENLPNLLASGIHETFPANDTPAAIKAAAGDHDLIHTSQILCPSGVCEPTINNMPILFDDNHLSMTAARLLAQDIIAQIAR